MYANHELDNCDAVADRLTVKWLEQGHKPRLMVQTKLNTLVELVFQGASSKDAKEQIRHDLRLLKEFVEILEDHRLKTQGTENWHFTLKLWSRSTQSNLEEFEREWQRRKLLKSRVIGHQSHLTADAGSKTAMDQRPYTHTPTASKTERASPLHNLPARCHTAFIGSKSNVTKLLKLLTFEHPATLITLEGTGGVGKTTLALEIAHRCRLATQSPADCVGIPIFDAIIFTSAKSQHFIGSHLSQRLKIESNLQDIFRVICRTLQTLDGAPLGFNQQLEYVQDCLAQQRTLLIVDNLETLEEQDYILSLLYELPSTVKIILTSRVRLGIGTAISLGCLSQDDGLALIQHYAQEKDVSIDPVQAQSIYQQAGGLPLAIAYGMGQFAVYGKTWDDASAHLVQPSSDFMEYCFKKSVDQLRGEPGYRLLMALTLFTQSAPIEALESVAFATMNVNVTREGLATLYRLSLVEPRQGYYGLHPLTRRYISAELNLYPDFEQEARNRLIHWYLIFLKPYGKRNWRDWQEFDSLEQEWENLRGVIEWCRSQDCYDDFRQLWQQLKGYTQLYGHWHERLLWMDWLTEAAEKRKDTATLADALYHASRTLYLFNQPEQTQKAIALSQQAWQLAQTQDNWTARVDLTIHLAALHSQQQQFDRASDWLNRGEALLQQTAQESQTELYQWVDIDYYRAQICFKNNDYSQSRQLYTEALRKAERAGWQRAIVYIKSWLSAVAIAQGHLSEAEQLLDFVRLQSSQHNDKRCLSFCQNYWALLEKERGDLIAARQWAQAAKEGFEQLNMHQQVNDMNVLLEQ